MTVFTVGKARIARIEETYGPTYRAGDIFFVPAGRSHTEEIGAPGAKIVVGRKY